MPIPVKFNIYFPVTVSKSLIDGLGVYACAKIPARRKIGSLGGVIISKRQANKRVKALRNTSIAMVELWNGNVIDASVNSNALRYINHSCTPILTCGYAATMWSFIL